MKKQKAILKNKKNIVKSSVITIAIAATILGGVHTTSNLITYDYGTFEQVQEIEQVLDTEISYRYDYLRRLKHNGNEPIYVSIGDEYTADNRERVIKALDNIFSIVGEINPNYRYELVDDIEEFKYLNKTTIKFGTANHNDANATARMWLNAFSIYSNTGHLSEKCSINFDAEYLESAGDRIVETALHELLHCFGFDDAYSDNDNGYHSNTMMNTDLYSVIPLCSITPNDYKILCALYAPRMNDVMHRKEYIANTKQMIDEYSKEFYAKYSKEFIKREVARLKELDIYSDERINQIITTKPIENDIDVIFNDLINIHNKSETIRVQVKNNKYAIVIYDADGKVINRCTGFVYRVDGELFLQDVKIDSFMYEGKAAYIDIRLVLNEYQNVYEMADLTGIDIANNGIDYVLQDIQGLEK